MSIISGCAARGTCMVGDVEGIGFRAGFTEVSVAVLVTVEGWLSALVTGVDTVYRCAYDTVFIGVLFELI